MRVYSFDLLKEDDVIIVNAKIEDRYLFRLAIDTAATHTTIDSNVLYFSGYELKNSKGEAEIETSNGVIVVEKYEIEKLECLGIIKENVEVQVYDFLAHGIISDYDGVIGLDFMREHKLCIDFPKSEIIIDEGS